MTPQPPPDARPHDGPRDPATAKPRGPAAARSRDSAAATPRDTAAATPRDTAAATPRDTAAAKPRDSAATRRALLDAARTLFATAGYDATTVRAVADLAGVNQALLFRYFGNKEGLFAEAVTGEAIELLSDGPPDDLLERTLTAMLADDQGRGAEILMAVLRAAGSSRVAEEVRTRLGQAYSAAFVSLVDTDDPADAAVRADLLLAWLLGIALHRSVLRAGLLHDPSAVTDHVLRAATTLLGGPRRGPGEGTA